MSTAELQNYFSKEKVPAYFSYHSSAAKKSNCLSVLINRDPLWTTEFLFIFFLIEIAELGTCQSLCYKAVTLLPRMCAYTKVCHCTFQFSDH